MTQTFRLHEALVLHLADGLGLALTSADAELWQRCDRPELSSGRMLSIFGYDTTWEYQERHPDGEELVLVLDGAVDFLLDADDGDGEQGAHLEQGEACLVPVGVWHRAAVPESCTMLFVTPAPARTEHRSLRSAARA